jgi:hypothetical protein
MLSRDHADLGKERLQELFAVVVVAVVDGVANVQACGG